MGSPPLPPSQSFTVTAHRGLLNVLKTSCSIAAGFNPGVDPDQPLKPFTAIWDTGATASVITRRVVDQCGLKPIGIAQVHGVGGEHRTLVYLVNIWLPNSVGFAQVRVTEGALLGGEHGDVLIGMDIITKGDFSISSGSGNTVFSFRVPSLLSTDFVAEHNRAIANATGPRNRQDRGHKPSKRPGKKFGKRK